MYQGLHIYKALHSAGSNAALAQIEQNVNRTKIPDFVQLTTCNELHMLQENDPDVAFMHESHHPYARESTERRVVVLCLNGLEIKARPSRTAR